VLRFARMGEQWLQIPRTMDERYVLVDWQKELTVLLRCRLTPTHRSSHPSLLLNQKEARACYQRVGDGLTYLRLNPWWGWIHNRLLWQSRWRFQRRMASETNCLLECILPCQYSVLLHHGQDHQERIRTSKAKRAKWLLATHPWRRLKQRYKCGRELG
jgi:hypothetical protein